MARELVKDFRKNVKAMIEQHKMAKSMPMNPVDQMIKMAQDMNKTNGMMN